MARLEHDGYAYEDRMPLPEMPGPGMAFVPYQQWTDILHSPEKALKAGTLFPVLDKPFKGMGVTNK